MCFRSTTEYYCKQEMDIYQLYPRLSTLSHTNTQGKTTVINSKLPSKSSSRIDGTSEKGMDSESHTFTDSVIAKVNVEDDEIIEESKEIEKKNCSTHHMKDYFLPRVNSTFALDLLNCIEHFKLTRECVTNNKTWHTIQELVISRLD